MTFSKHHQKVWALALAPTLLFFLCFFASANAPGQSSGRHPAAAKEGPRKVRLLFIGNSYTYFNNLPQMVADLAEASAPPVELEIERITVGGATLKKHWEEGKALETIRRSKWDYVVLQEQSTLGPAPLVNGSLQINNPKIFYEYARRFDQEIKRSGAKTVFFMTWARLSAPDTQAPLTSAYTVIANELKAILAPVGVAWEKALNENPELRLHLPDESHPTPAGSYLAACVLLATLFDRNPEGLPSQLLGVPIDTTGKPLEQKGEELVNLSPATAGFLQRLAWNSVKKIDKSAER